VSIAGAFSHVSDFSNFGVPVSVSVNTAQPAGSDYFQIGAYAEHVPTGLFLYGAYGHLTAGVLSDDADANNTFYVKGGIRTRCVPLGHTVFYGEFLRAENNFSSFNVDSKDTVIDPVTGDTILNPANNVVGAETRVNVWGLGVVQEIDAAAMSVWIKFRHLNEHDNVSGFSTDSFDEVATGALINF